MNTSGDGALRIELFVEDIERSAAFYRDVLGFTREYESDGYVAMRRGSAVFGIGLARNLPPGHHLRRRDGDRNGVGVEIVLEVDDVEAALAAVERAGYPVLTPLAARPWGSRDFRLLDPDGYYLRITSHA